MLAVAAQLAAVLPVRAVRGDQALTHRMGALHTRFSHNAPPRQHSTPIRRRAAIRLSCAVIGGVFACLPANAHPLQPDFTETLARIAHRVEQWYARAASIVSTENVWIQTLRADMTPDDFPRRLAFELRVDWDPSRTGPASGAIANILREPLRVDGRRPAADDPGCMDPKPVSPEPLGMLLPTRLAESEFTPAGTARIDGRAALLIDYRGLASLPEEITWTKECVSLMLPGRSRGRIWVDAETFDVLRMDDRLVGTFSFDVPREHIRRGAARSMIVERADSSIRYRRVAFADPAETLLLPASIETVTVIRGASTQRTRITQRFSDYRRFITAGRIVD
jgi:hypothetical protein